MVSHEGRSLRARSTARELSKRSKTRQHQKHSKSAVKQCQKRCHVTNEAQSLATGCKMEKMFLCKEPLVWADAVHNKPELRARRSRKVRNREQETQKKNDNVGPFVQNAQQEAAWSQRASCYL